MRFRSPVGTLCSSPISSTECSKVNAYASLSKSRQLWRRATSGLQGQITHSDLNCTLIRRCRVFVVLGCWRGIVHVFPVGEKRCLDLGDEQDVVRVLLYGLGLTRARMC